MMDGIIHQFCNDDCQVIAITFRQFKISCDLNTEIFHFFQKFGAAGNGEFIRFILRAHICNIYNLSFSVKDNLRLAIYIYLIEIIILINNMGFFVETVYILSFTLANFNGCYFY
jgi:hypothetical protein